MSANKFPRFFVNKHGHIRKFLDEFDSIFIGGERDGYPSAFELGDAVAFVLAGQWNELTESEVVTLLKKEGE